MDDENRREEQDLLREDPLRIARGITLGVAIGSVIWAVIIGLVIIWLMD
jgi:hypothetical protein